MELDFAPAIEDEKTLVDEIHREMPDIPKNTIRVVYRAARRYVHPSDAPDALMTEVRRLLEETMAS